MLPPEMPSALFVANRWRWVSAFALVVMLALVAAPPQWQAALALDRAGLAAGQWWRLWTGHAVHYGLVHAAVNAAALAVLWWWLGANSGLHLALGALICLPLLGMAILLLEPALTQYRGASGAVVWLGTLAWWRAWQQRRAGRVGLLMLAVAPVAKLAWESWPGHVVRSGSLPDDVALAWSAHLAGAVLGLGWAVACRGWARRAPGR